MKGTKGLVEIVEELDLKSKKFLLQAFKTFMDTYSQDTVPDASETLKQKLLSNPEILRIMLKLQQELKIAEHVAIPKLRKVPK